MGLFTGQMLQAASRLFPFGRGLTHAYWAPNVWALYNTADRVLSKLGFGVHGLPSSTAGFAEVYESSVLWTVPPKATFALTLLLYVPLFIVIWRQTPPSQSSKEKNASKRKKFNVVPVQRRGAFALYVSMGSAIAFSVGWHVHEKAILMVTIPLVVAALGIGHKELSCATCGLSFIGTFSVLPLMPN